MTNMFKGIAFLIFAVVIISIIGKTFQKYPTESVLGVGIIAILIVIYWIKEVENP